MDSFVIFLLQLCNSALIFCTVPILPLYIIIVPGCITVLLIILILLVATPFSYKPPKPPKQEPPRHVSRQRTEFNKTGKKHMSYTATNIEESAATEGEIYSNKLNKALRGNGEPSGVEEVSQESLDQDGIEGRVEEKVKKDRTFFANNKKSGNNRSKRVGEKKKFSNDDDEGIFLSDLHVNVQVVQPLQSTPQVTQNLPSRPVEVSQPKVSQTVLRKLVKNRAAVDPNVKVMNSQRTSVEIEPETISLGTLSLTSSDSMNNKESFPKMDLVDMEGNGVIAQVESPNELQIALAIANHYQKDFSLQRQDKQYVASEKPVKIKDYGMEQPIQAVNPQEIARELENLRMERSPTEHSFKSLVRNTKEDYSRYQEIHAQSEEFYEKEINHGKELNTTADIPPPEPLAQESSQPWYGNKKDPVYSTNLQEPIYATNLVLQLNLQSEPYSSQVPDAVRPNPDYPERDMSQFEKFEKRNQRDSETESSAPEPSAYRKKAFPQIKSQSIRKDSTYLDLGQPYYQYPDEDPEPVSDHVQQMTPQSHVTSSRGSHVTTPRGSHVTTPRRSDTEEVMFIPDEVQKALDVIGRYSNRFSRDVNLGDVQGDVRDLGDVPVRDLGDGSTVQLTPKTRGGTNPRQRAFLQPRSDKRQSESMRRDKRQSESMRRDKRQSESMRRDKRQSESMRRDKRQSEIKPERRSEASMRPNRRHMERPDDSSDASLRRSEDRRQTKSTTRIDERQSVGSMRLDRGETGRQSEGQYNLQKMNSRHKPKLHPRPSEPILNKPKLHPRPSEPKLHPRPSDQPVLKAHPRHARPAVEGRLKSGASSPFLYGSPVHSTRSQYSMSNSEYTNPYYDMSERERSEKEQDYRSRQMSREDEYANDQRYSMDLESFTSEYTNQKKRGNVQSDGVIADLMTSGELDVTSAVDLQATLSDLESALGGLDEWMDTDVQDMAV